MLYSKIQNQSGSWKKSPVYDASSQSKGEKEGYRTPFYCLTHNKRTRPLCPLISSTQEGVIHEFGWAGIN